MPTVNKFYDSFGVPTAIHSATDIDPQAQPTSNPSFFGTNAAGQRGVLEAPLASLWWWRQGADVHLVAVATRSEGSSAPTCAIQRGVARMPSNCVAINVVSLATLEDGGRGGGLLFGVVGVTDRCEVVCSRVHVGVDAATSTFFLRCLTDVYMSDVFGPRSVCGTAAASGSNAEGELVVLVGLEGGHLRSVVVGADGTPRVSEVEEVPNNNNGETCATVCSIALVVSPTTVAQHVRFVVGRTDGSVSLVEVMKGDGAAASRIMAVHASHGAPTSIAAAAVAMSSASMIDVRVAIGTESGDVVLASLALNNNNNNVFVGRLTRSKVVAQPADGAVASSLFVSTSGTVVVGWCNCELWSVPVSCAAVFTANANKNTNAADSNNGIAIVGTFNVDCVALPTEAALTVWQLGTHADADPFWFVSGTAPTTVLMAAASAFDGNIMLYAAADHTVVGKAVSNRALMHCPPAEVAELIAQAAGGDCSGETLAMDHSADCGVLAVPLSPEEGESSVRDMRSFGDEKAFLCGVALLGSVPNGFSSLRYLINRVLLCPDRFSNYSEFLELRTDALISGFVGEEVTENDVRAALDVVSCCEDTHNPFYCTPTFIYESVRSDLCARLTFLIVVYAAWSSTSTSGSFASSEVTAEVCHAVEVLAASIRVTNTLGIDTQEVLAATRANSSESNDHNGDNCATMPIISSIVNELSQISVGGIVDMVRVAKLLSVAVPHNSSGVRASAQWVATLKSRNPIVSHFSIMGAVASGAAPRGGQSAVVVAESLSVSSCLAMTPLEVGKQLLGELGLFELFNGSAAQSSVVVCNADFMEYVQSDVEQLVDAYPALLPLVYKSLLLRRLVGSHSASIAPTHLEMAFLPAVHIVRRYAAAGEPLSGALLLLLVQLVADVHVVLCRAAIDEHAYVESLRSLSSAHRAWEVAAAAATAFAAAPTAGLINTNAIAARREVIIQYVNTIVDAASREERLCDLSAATLLDNEIVEAIAQRLFWLSGNKTVVVQSAVVEGASSSSSVSAKFSPQQVEANETVRFSAAVALNDFLCRRGAFGHAAHALFVVAASARMGSYAGLSTAAHVVKLLTLAVAAARMIPPVPPPPPHLITAAEHTKNELDSRFCSAGGSASHLRSAVGSPIPHIVNLTPLSREDVPILEKRLFQSRCELQLMRVPRNVVKGVWREGDAADRTRVERLVEELLAVRLWPEARRLSLLSGLDETLVYQCEAADLATVPYDRNTESLERWDDFVERLARVSTVENEYLPMRRVLTAVTAVDHRNVCPSLKLAMMKCDVGVYLTTLLNCGKPSSGLANTSLSMSPNGDDAVNRRLLPRTIIREVLAVATKYLRGRKAAGDHAMKSSQYGAAMHRVNLPPTAFVSTPLLERIEVLAQTVLASSEGKTEESSKVVSMARVYIDVLLGRRE